MALFQSTQVFPRPRDEVFAFFCRPANLIAVSPPELYMKLEEGPDLLQLGSRVVLRGRRWGISQRIVSEVTALAQGESFTDVQIEGPFRKFEHTHRFREVAGGTEVLDQLEFEPPGGMLGLLVTVGRIEKDLTWIFEYRTRKLAELLGGQEVR